MTAVNAPRGCHRDPLLLHWHIPAAERANLHVKWGGLQAGQERCFIWLLVIASLRQLPTLPDSVSSAWFLYCLPFHIMDKANLDWWPPLSPISFVNMEMIISSWKKESIWLLTTLMDLCYSNQLLTYQSYPSLWNLRGGGGILKTSEFWGEQNSTFYSKISPRGWLICRGSFRKWCMQQSFFSIH